MVPIISSPFSISPDEESLIKHRNCLSCSGVCIKDCFDGDLDSEERCIFSTTAFTCFSFHSEMIDRKAWFLIRDFDTIVPVNGDLSWLDNHRWIALLS